LSVARFLTFVEEAFRCFIIIFVSPGSIVRSVFFFLKTRSNVANVIYYSTSNEYNDISIIRAERNDVTYSFSNVIRRYFKKSIFRNTAGNPYIVNRCIGRIKNAHTRRIRNSRPQVQREPRRIRQPKGTTTTYGSVRVEFPFGKFQFRR